MDDPEEEVRQRARRISQRFATTCISTAIINSFARSRAASAIENSPALEPNRSAVEELNPKFLQLARQVQELSARLDRFELNNSTTPPSTPPTAETSAARVR